MKQFQVKMPICTPMAGGFTYCMESAAKIVEQINQGNILVLSGLSASTAGSAYDAKIEDNFVVATVTLSENDEGLKLQKVVVSEDGRPLVVSICVNSYYDVIGDYRQAQPETIEVKCLYVNEYNV